MVRKAIISILVAIVFVITAGCSDPFNLSGNGSDKFVSADVTGKSSRGDLWFAEVNLAPTDAQTLAEGSTGESQVAREIEEADKVKLIDHTLYLLNNYRGLRIVDVADWSKPVLKGAFGFVGRPVEMYVTNQVATIVVVNNGSCRLDEQAQVVKQSGTTVYLVDVSNVDTPRQINAFEIDGFVSETRRVGDVVYLAGTNASQADLSYSSTENSPDGFVASIFVADPLKVALVDQKTFAGKGQYIHATPNAIFVSGMDWEAGVSTIQYVDISDPGGTIALRGTCQVPGQILDRFAMDANENVLRVVSDNQRWFRSWQAKEEETDYGVKLFTFDLSNPDAITELGRLFIIGNETVRAVRFDGLKGYVVTYQQRDPLWVVDLSNPADPKITGFLEAPGYSTHLETDGNRLIAVGLDDTAGWRACAMLYDVADPAAPKELDREILGEGYSSSEANYDDKAFTVIPEADLILVPYDTWKDGYQNRLAMIDYSGDALTNLAQIDHRGTVVRSGADLAANVLWVLSQDALQTLNIANRQSPQQLAMVTLAENVLAYKPVGQYGLRLVSRSENWNAPMYELQAVNGNDPNGAQILSTLSLSMHSPQMIRVDNALVVISGQNSQGMLRLSAVNISELPNLTLAGEKEFDFGSTFGGESGPYLLENKNLVYITGDNVLKAVSLADPADMKVAGEVEIPQTDDVVVMQTGVSGNKIYQSVMKCDTTNYWTDIFGTNNTKPVAPCYLRLIDFTDPAGPQVDDLRNVPGIVVGLQGDTVFTIDPQWTDEGVTRSFCSVRLSNVSSEIMSKVDLPEGDPGKVIFTGDTVILTVGQGNYWWGWSYAMKATNGDTECQMGNFWIVSIRIADPYNLVKATDSEYPGYGWIAGVADGYVVGQISYPTQALIWQIADDKSLALKTVINMPDSIQDVSTTNGLLNLVCGYGGVSQVNLNP